MLPVGSTTARRPAERLRVNYAHPVARKLRNAIVFGANGAYEAISGKPIRTSAAFGTPFYGPTPYGVGLRTPNGAAATLTLGEDWSGPCTVIYRCLINSVDVPWGGFWFKNGSSARQLGVGRNASTNTWYLTRDGANISTLGSTSVSGDSGSVVTIAVINSTSDGSGALHYYYKNGALVQSVAQSLTGQASGAGDLTLSADSGLTATYDSDVWWYEFLRFGSVLSAQEIAWIGRDTAKLFRRAPVRQVVGVSAGGGAITIDATTGNAVAAGVTGVAGVAATINGVVGNATAAGITGTVSVDLIIAGVVGNAVAAGVTGAPAVGISIDGVLGNAVAAGVPGVPGVSIEIAGTVGNAVAAGVAGLAEVGGSISIDGVVGNAVAAGVAGSPGVAITITGNVGNAVAAGVSGLAAIGILIDGVVGNATAAGVTGGLSLDIVVVGVVGNAAAAGVTGAVSLSGGSGADPADVWAYELAPGVSAGQYVTEIHAMLTTLTGGSVVLPVNVKQVNDVTIAGAGVAGSNPWRPA